ncbi:MAG: sulfotransferase family 2 domain-containing protein [Pseudomonadota bacterium]
MNSPHAPEKPKPHPRYGELTTHHSAAQIDRLFLMSLRRKYLYCPVSKVANSSIKGFLYEAELRAHGIPRNARDFTTAQVHNLLFGPLLNPYQVPANILRKMLYGEETVRILFTRNPVDRVLSCYLDRVLTPASVPSKLIQSALKIDRAEDISFDAFISVVAEQDIREMNPHWRPIYYEACCDAVTYNRIYQFEALQDGLRSILTEIYPRWAADIDLGTNLSPAKTRAADRIAEFVTPAIRTKIEKIYEKDFQTFGY